MKERIKQLAEQNGFIHNWMTPGEQHDKLKSLEKFAEVIVRECANIANNAEPYQANDLILKHFGIIQLRSLLCPKCGTDRTKSACPRGYGAAVDGSCPMVFKAQ